MIDIPVLTETRTAYTLSVSDALEYTPKTITLFNLYKGTV